MATYKGDWRYRYKCVKCGNPLTDQAHGYCVTKNLPDLCFQHQPRTIKKELKRYERKGVIDYGR